MPEANLAGAALPFLSTRGLTKRFPGVVATNGIDLDIMPGEVHALLGENGAGKTTLISMLYGLLQPDEGEIRVAGSAMRIRDPRHAMELGLGLVAQHFHLARRHTVAENLALGQRGAPFWRPTLQLRAKAGEIAERYGLDVSMDARVSSLSPGEQQRIEILKALMQGAKLLILDEPTSVLTPQEADALFEVVERMRADDRAVVFISHKLNEVQRVADRITVLRAGSVVGRLVRGEADSSQLASLMVGRQVASPQRLGVVSKQEPLLVVNDLWLRGARGVDALRGTTFSVRPGEVIGIAGVAGNGQSELAQVLAGLARPTSGSVKLGGLELGRLTPREVRAAGVAYIPEDRRTEGVVGAMSVMENLVLRQVRDPGFARGVLIDWRKAEEFAAKAVKEFDIRTPSLRTEARTLSGGNVQKIVLARELSGKPRLVVASHPTYGLDIGSTNHTHELLLAQRGRGAAVVVISEDLDELIKLADRVLVMFGGRVVGSMPVAEAATDEGVQRLGLLMAGSLEA